MIFAQRQTARADQDDVSATQAANLLGHLGFKRSMSNTRRRLRSNIRHCKSLHQEIEFAKECNFISQDENTKFPVVEAFVAMSALHEHGAMGRHFNDDGTIMVEQWRSSRFASGSDGATHLHFPMKLRSATRGQEL